MGLEQIVPAIALIAVLILVLPNFLKSNSEKKQLFQKKDGSGLGNKAGNQDPIWKKIQLSGKMSNLHKS